MSLNSTEIWKYIHHILLETMEGRLRWSLPEAEIYRDILEMNQKWAGISRHGNFKKDLIRKNRLYREKLRNLNHLNAKLFTTQFVSKKNCYHVVIKEIDSGVQLIFHLEPQVKSKSYALVLYQMLMDKSPSIKVSLTDIFTYSSDEYSELITLLFLLRDPANIQFHSECKYAYPYQVPIK